MILNCMCLLRNKYEHKNRFASKLSERLLPGYVGFAVAADNPKSEKHSLHTQLSKPVFVRHVVGRKSI